MSETTIEVDGLPLVIDDTIVQGATFRRTFFYLPAGVPAVDFGDWTAAMQLRAKVAQVEEPLNIDPVLELTTENGGLTLDDDGSVVILITATQSQALLKGAKYDLELYQPAGDTIRFLKGTLSLDKEITR